MLFFFLLGVVSLQAQSNKDQLEARRRKLEQDIAYTRSLIQKAQKGKEQSLAEVRLLNRQLAMQEQLLVSLDEEVDALETEVSHLRGLTEVMEADLQKLRDHYGKLAYQAYVYQIGDAAVLWILSAESFAQAYNRLLFYRQLSRQRAEQIRLIRRAQQRLLEQQAAIDASLRTKQELLDKKRRESELLAANRRRHEDLYRNLRLKEQGYSQKLREYEDALVKVKAKINALIKEDVKRSSSASVATKKGYIRISGQFERAKGKLPWPVQVTRGVVTGRFGRVKDASGGVVDNDGIYITTDPDQPVRAVYGGKVTAVASYPGLGQLIIVQHGNYRTVYVNLKDVQVKQGEKVLPLQTIARVRTNAAGTAELHFLLYQDQTAVNPIGWLGKQR